jgi:hypothetical protein
MSHVAAKVRDQVFLAPGGRENALVAAFRSEMGQHSTAGSLAAALGD